MRTLRLASLAVFLVGGGCSFLLSTAEPSQCSSQRDCDAEPAFRDRICREGFCVVPAAKVDPVSTDSGPGCVSSQLCTQANSGKASVCKKAGGACTPWVTPQCPTIRGAWADPNAIVIGSLQPFSVKQANGQFAKVEYAERVQRAIDLGLDELTAAAPTGIAVPGGPHRPFAVLHCDSSYDLALARAAMSHLTEVVGAQAIIVGADQDLAAVSAQAAEKKTAIACSDCVAPFPPGAIAWRIVPPLALEAPMVAWRVSELETTIKAGPTPPAVLRVAVLATPEPAPSAFISALIAKLRFNNKSVVENGASFTVVTTEDVTKQAVNYGAHADTLASFAPDVLVVAMGAEFPAHYLQLIEAKWPAGKPRPYYVMTALNFEVAPFVSVLGPADEDLRKRLSGARPGFDQALQDNIDSYSLRYKQANNFKAPDGNFSGYDAFYSMAYAIAAASTQLLLDGPHISAGFERLGAGTVIDLGPAQLGLAIAILGGPAGTINARGLLSHLDWNVTTRELVVPDSSLYCFQRDAGGGLVIKHDAGPRFTNSTGLVSGTTYSCD